MENNDEKPNINNEAVVNSLLLIAIEQIVDSRAYLVTIMDELARQNSITNGTTLKEEKEKLDKDYKLNKNGGHARFANQIKDSMPHLSPLMDDYLKDLI